LQLARTREWLVSSIQIYEPVKKPQAGQTEQVHIALCYQKGQFRRRKDWSGTPQTLRILILTNGELPILSDGSKYDELVEKESWDVEFEDWEPLEYQEFKIVPSGDIYPPTFSKIIIAWCERSPLEIAA